MNIVLYGASGNAGRRILHELIARGHQVTAVVRNPDTITEKEKCLRDDLSSEGRIAAIIAGTDAVVSAYAPPQNDTDQLIAVTEREIAAIRKANGPRLIVVGGAGSLEVAPGVTLLASGHLPEEWVPIVMVGRDAQELAQKAGRCTGFYRRQCEGHAL